jgi:predicted peptidase
MVNVLGAILQQTLKDYPVDPDRVYLSGLSSGGSACWIIASEHPEWFAAVAPLASGGAGLHRIPKLAKVPIWAFHSSRDSTLSPERDRAMIAGLAKAGGVARLTEIDSTDHDCWTAAFRDHHLMSWLLAQHRNGPIWQWWQILLQIVVIVGFVGFARLVYWLFRRVQIARELAQAA